MAPHIILNTSKFTLPLGKYDVIYYESRYNEDSGYTYLANRDVLLTDVSNNVASIFLEALYNKSDGRLTDIDTEYDPIDNTVSTLTIYVEGSRFTYAHIYYVFKK